MYGYANEPEVEGSVKRININMKKKNAYIVIADGQIRAATTKSDIEKHMADEKSIIKPEESHADDILIYGLVLDASCLPYELPEKYAKEKDLYLIVDSGSSGIDFKQLENLDEVTEAIVSLINMNKDLRIDDFVVVLGEEIPLVYAPARIGDSVTPYQVLGEI